MSVSLNSAARKEKENANLRVFLEEQKYYDNKYESFDFLISCMNLLRLNGFINLSYILWSVKLLKYVSLGFVIPKPRNFGSCLQALYEVISF